MVPIQNVKMTVGPIWNTGGTETEISVPVSVLGPQRAGTEMGGDRFTNMIQTTVRQKSIRLFSLQIVTYNS